MFVSESLVILWQCFVILVGYFEVVFSSWCCWAETKQNYAYPKTYGLKYILKMNALQAHRVLFPIIISDLFRQTWLVSTHPRGKTTKVFVQQIMDAAVSVVDPWGGVLFFCLCGLLWNILKSNGLLGGTTDCL